MSTDNKFYDKANTLAENLLMAKPCRGCSQYLHFSQMNFVDIPNLDSELLNVDSLETLEAVKLKYTNSEILCNNCNALRLFKLSNK